MQWILKYWVAIVVAIVSIGAGVGLAMMSANTNKPPREVQPPILGDDVDLSDNPTETIPPLLLPALNTKNTIKPGTTPVPITLPPELVPWGTGASNPSSTPSTGGSSGSLPPELVPWGSGPSQQ